MDDPHNLQRFIDAQGGVYEVALEEIRAGSKTSHWMWFIFPQLKGLGHSQTAKFYGIASLEEARSYLSNSILGPRLGKCVDALLAWRDRRSAEQVLGPVDAMKLRSSLTLFERVEPDGAFAEALGAFFAGDRDERTLALLNAPL